MCKYNLQFEGEAQLTLEANDIGEAYKKLNRMGLRNASNLFELVEAEDY